MTQRQIMQGIRRRFLYEYSGGDAFTDYTSLDVHGGGDAFTDFSALDRHEGGDSKQYYAGMTTPQDFVLTAATTGASETMTIPCQNNGVFNATIDWGDGSALGTITAYNDADLSHVYATAGTYTITISGQFPNVYFYGNATMAAKVRAVVSLGIMGWVSLYRAFRGCSGMTSFSAAGVTTGITSIKEMLFGGTALVSADVSSLDLSNATNAASAFQSLPSLLSLSLVGLDFSGITDTSQMVRGNTLMATFDISGLDFSAMLNIASMLRDCPALADSAIDGLDISAVTNSTNFMLGSSVSTSRLDATFIAWDALTVQSGLSVSFGGSTYTAGGEAEAARSRLIADDGWYVTDGGPE